MSAPKRRYRLRLDLHADTAEELGRVLRQLDTDLIVEYRERLAGDGDHVVEVASGGPDSGYNLEIAQDASVTPERYRVALDAYIAEQREALDAYIAEKRESANQLAGNQ